LNPLCWKKFLGLRLLCFRGHRHLRRRQHQIFHRL
jgi:hypothetical protein